MTGEIVWLPKAKEDLKRNKPLFEAQYNVKIQHSCKTEVLQKVSDLLTYPERYSPDEGEIS